MTMIEPGTLPAFSDMGSRIRLHAQQAPARRALVEGERRLDYGSLDLQMDRIAAALQRDGVEPGDAIAICAASSIEYASVFLGALRAGMVVAPLAPGATPASLQSMLADADAKLLFTARDVDVGEGGPPRVAMDGSAAGRTFDDWLAGCASPRPVAIYHKRAEATREAEWFDATGKRFIRTGDIGRFDADGFLTLLDRRKDVIISGGFNIYPSDLEAVLREHPAVADVAVVGVRSRQWGETPVAFVVRGAGQEATDDAALLQWANARLGKTQRLHSLRSIDALPRSPIGKVLKRDLREGHGPV